MQREHKCSTSKPRYREARESEWLEACSASVRRNRAVRASSEIPGDTPPVSPCLHRQGLRETRGAAGHRVGSRAASPHRALLTARNTGCRRPWTPPSTTLGALQEAQGARMCEDRELPAASTATLAARTRGSTAQQDAACGRLPDQARSGPRVTRGELEPTTGTGRYLSLAPESTWCPARRSA